MFLKTMYLKHKIPVFILGAVHPVVLVGAHRNDDEMMKDYENKCASMVYTAFCI